MSRFARLLCVLILVAGIVGRASAASSGGPRARLLAAPMPVYPEPAIQARIRGYGKFRIEMDLQTGKPLRIVILRSTGSPVLDRAAVTALRQWRAVPGGVRQIDLPLFFRVTSRGASVTFQ